MAVVAAPDVNARTWNWRDAVFIVVAAVAALLYGSAARFLLAPWSWVGDPGFPDPALDRWHQALGGAVNGLLGGGTTLATL